MHYFTRGFLKPIYITVLFFALLPFWGQTVYAQKSLTVSGEPKELSGYIIPNKAENLDSNGELAGGIIISTDITELKFQSSNGILRVEEENGNYILILPTNAGVLTVSNDDYPPFQIVLNDYGIDLRSGMINWELTITSEADNTVDNSTEEVYTMVEKMPTIIGGSRSIYSNLVYPEMARMMGIQGFVTVEFIVNKEGKAENLRVLRGIGAGCDEAAIDVIKKLSFTPGSQRGETVRVKQELGIRFVLND